MHYKYVWRGLEEMFKFAHLHNLHCISINYMIYEQIYAQTFGVCV